ncbi:hypothetical protein [Teichococcus vastitatis]|uniref:Uncharacterized protein n=1 Tax=Teichococcus vastitatis TaxID=2307076 RepID=A0ABS9W4D3_9PROT|nr:hypothetical protein [Pseudoroseomonas vastitatis]MCI0754141.1 hypothetical protein [Pseudoroseomonas vastitatis]
MTLGTLVWSAHQPLPHLPTLDQSVDIAAAQRPTTQGAARMAPRGMPAAAPGDLQDLAESQGQTREQEAEALLAEVEELLRQADAMQATLDRLDTPRSSWPEPEVLAALAPESVVEAELPAIAMALPVSPVPAPGAAAIAKTLLVEPPAAMASLALPELFTARPAEETMPSMVAALPPAPAASRPSAPARNSAPQRTMTPPRSAPVRMAVERSAMQVQPVSMPGPMQRRCRAIILRAQLGEEPTRADQDFLQEGCR